MEHYRSSVVHSWWYRWTCDQNPLTGKRVKLLSLSAVPQRRTAFHVTRKWVILVDDKFSLVDYKGFCLQTLFFSGYNVSPYGITNKHYRDHTRKKHANLLLWLQIFYFECLKKIYIRIWWKFWFKNILRRNNFCYTKLLFGLLFGLFCFSIGFIQDQRHLRCSRPCCNSSLSSGDNQVETHLIHDWDPEVTSR